MGFPNLFCFSVINIGHKCIAAGIPWQGHTHSSERFLRLVQSDFQKAEACSFQLLLSPELMQHHLNLITIHRDWGLFHFQAAVCLICSGELWGGCDSGGRKKNYIAACLLPVRDVRGSCYIWLLFFAKFFNCFVIWGKKNPKGDERKQTEITNNKQNKFITE